MGKCTEKEIINELTKMEEITFAGSEPYIEISLKLRDKISKALKASIKRQKII